MEFLLDDATWAKIIQIIEDALYLPADALKESFPQLLYNEDYLILTIGGHNLDFRLKPSALVGMEVVVEHPPERENLLP